MSIPNSNNPEKKMYVYISKRENENEQTNVIRC